MFAKLLSLAVALALAVTPALGASINAPGITPEGVITPGNCAKFGTTKYKLTDAGACTGTGTVSSVGLALPNIFTVTGSPVTVAGTLTGTFNTQSANTVFSGPSSGPAATPTFRALVGADLPNPSATTLGGVQSKVAVSHNFLNTISTSGVPGSTQPACADLSDASSGCSAAAGITALTGDGTATGPGSSVLTLASIITAGGPTGSGTVVPVITYDAKGRLTAVTTATITYPGSFSGFANPSASLGVAAVNGSATTAMRSDAAPAINQAAAFAFSNLGQTAVVSASFGLSGNISSAAWTTNGVRYKNVAATLTDTTSSGTVAAAYTDVWGGNTIAASSATTFTNYYGAYFKAPVVGSNVTFTNGWALGADSFNVAGNGAASASPLLMSGTILTGSTGTTNFPQFFIQPTGTTASTTWSTNGTVIGVNAPGAFTGNLLDLQIGGSSFASINQNGRLTLNGAIVAGATGSVSWNGRGLLTSPAAGSVQVGNVDIDTNASIVAQTLRSQGALAGGTADQAGKNLTVIASPGKGTGAGGSFIVQTAPAGSTGTSVNAPVTALTIDSTGLATFASNFLATVNGALSTGAGPAIKANGTWITGGSATTTKPYILIEPTGTASTNWSTSGTGIGINAASGFAGNALDFQAASVRLFRIDGNGNVDVGGTLKNTAVVNGYQLTTGAPSSTVPNLVPNRADLTTGIGAQASGNISLISGGAEIARVTATAFTQIAGQTVLKGYTVSTLPTGIQGGTAFVTDQLTTCAAIGAALTGGGSVVCPAFYNGSAWVSG